MTDQQSGIIMEKKPLSNDGSDSSSEKSEEAMEGENRQTKSSTSSSEKTEEDMEAARRQTESILEWSREMKKQRESQLSGKDLAGLGRFGRCFRKCFRRKERVEGQFSLAFRASTVRNPLNPESLPKSVKPEQQVEMKQRRHSRTNTSAMLIDPEGISLGKVLGRGAEGLVRMADWEGQVVAVKVIELPLFDSTAEEGDGSGGSRRASIGSIQSAAWRESLLEATLLVWPFTRIWILSILTCGPSRV
jgi:hypothetical protein